jgi:hypothetical protein
VQIGLGLRILHLAPTGIQKMKFTPFLLLSSLRSAGVEVFHEGDRIRTKRIINQSLSDLIFEYRSELLQRLQEELEEQEWNTRPVGPIPDYGSELEGQGLWLVDVFEARVAVTIDEYQRWTSGRMNYEQKEKETGAGNQGASREQDLFIGILGGKKKKTI